MEVLMSAAVESLVRPTLTELAARFGPMPAHRIRLDRFPATEADVVEIHDRENRTCELVDGILVEKDVGYRESVVACALIQLLRTFVIERDLGAVAGSDGMMRLAPGLVRIPDVSFVSWEQFPGRSIPATPIPDIHPDLVVEVLSSGNTTKEMDGKLHDYFESNARLVWFVDPNSRTVQGFSSPDRTHATTLH